MNPAYLLIVGRDPGGSDLKDFLDSRERLPRLQPVFRDERMAAFASDHWQCIASDGLCVIGGLFRREDRAARLAALPRAEAAAIVASGGHSLLDHFWGGYVAALRSGTSIRILRDPSATLPCYFASGWNLVAFASDAETLAASGFAPASFDWKALAREFWDPGIPRPETPLRGIRELLAGFALDVADSTLSQQQCWSPWDHVRCAHSADPKRQLQEAVRGSVRSMAAGRGPLLLSVSGGLDSSILAACLAREPDDVACLTMYGEDPSSDERKYARELCGRLGLRLFERPYRLQDIDLDAPLGSHLPRSRDRTHAQAYELAHIEIANETGASAFVTGNGGDSVFGYSQSASALADRLLAQGPGRGAFQTLLDVCQQTECSLLDAAAAAWRIVRGPRAYQCRPNGLFLHEDILSQLAGTRPGHPWLEAPADALPGKAAHIAAILRVQQALEPSRGAALPVLSPLMAQPIMETCLGVPSWEWRSGGRDRSLARSAFADALPPLILARRVKGSPASFAGQVIESRRSDILDRLAGGRLARERIIDADAVRRVLERGMPLTDDERVRILELTAAEAWLGSWALRFDPRS